jgi:hypothetical protein
VFFTYQLYAKQCLILLTQRVEEVTPQEVEDNTGAQQHVTGHGQRDLGDARMVCQDQAVFVAGLLQHDMVLFHLWSFD